MHLMQPPREPSPPAALSLADFEELLLATQGQLYGFARSHGRRRAGTRHRAGGVCGCLACGTCRPAAVFLRACSGGAPPLALSCRVLAHLGVFRRRRILAWEPLDESDAPTAEAYSAATPFEDCVVEGEVLRAALASLSPADAACLLLSVVQGYTSAEIAEIVRIAPDAAKKRLSRAKQRLRAAYFAEERAMREETSP